MTSYFNLSRQDAIIVEKDLNISNDKNTTSFYIYIVTAFVYAFFIANLVERLLNYDHVEKVCKNNDVLTCINTEKAFNNKKFIYMMILGILSVFGGAYISLVSPEFKTGGCEVCTGGILLLIYYISINWGNINKNMQVGALGIAFFSLFYGSMKMKE
jgi:hypothetical protein